MRLTTAGDITLSDDYPDLVWENPGSRYGYQLIVGEKVFEIPGAEGDMIRFSLPRMDPGLFQYVIQVLFDGEIIYAPRKKNILRWMAEDEKQALNKEIQRIDDIAPGNGFLMGNLMDERGLKVAAMDQYREFLSEYPDAHETRPFLIKVLNELKLGKIEKTEIKKYRSQRKTS